VRTFIVPFLIALITACPFLCGVAESDHGSHRFDASAGTPCGPTSPAHCPQDGDDCICQGAVPPGGVRTSTSSAAVGLPIPGRPSLHARQHAAVRLPQESPATNLAGWGNPSSIQALLQNFRC